MPKFNKPQLNKSKVNKSKFDDRPNPSKSLPSESEIPPVQVDETIVTGRRPKPLNEFQRLLAELPELTESLESELFARLDRDIPVNAKQFETKIRKMLATKNIEVNRENSIKYLEKMKKNIQFPCLVTCIEEFEWEQEYIRGSGSKKEYARLKKTRPSYTDSFIINRSEDLFAHEEGIFVQVHRLSDRQKFMLPLSGLKSADLISPNHQLLDDYLMWSLNY
ncbi:hypothetical protein [Tychonema sp. LEGE 07203]|uniref:hypothetical protein n=1 Tax=Tychonema sp. LEGE 07203 TaxID=1828671 RepID=UPI0018810F9B|nr:hypothetical protein [Tychonema sp. LEGE 07203]MBE9092569.1 hypothetical protein [Tychonema sp. LEGE 07203]